MSENVRQCHLCEYYCPSLRLFVSHLRLVHSQDPNFNIVCNIAQCTEVFRSFSAFSTHIYRKHRTSLGLEESHGLSEPAESSAMIDLHAVSLRSSTAVPVMAVASYSDDSEVEGVSIPVLTGQVGSHPGVSDQRTQNAQFLLTLTEGRQLSQVALNEVIEICRTISKQTVSQIKEGVLSALNDAGVNSALVPGLDDSFLSVPDAFEKLDTPYLREKFYREHFNYQVCFISHTIAKYKHCGASLIMETIEDCQSVIMLMLASCRVSLPYGDQANVSRRRGKAL